MGWWKKMLRNGGATGGTGGTSGAGGFGGEINTSPAFADGAIINVVNRNLIRVLP
jgi:hypothetical protein